MLHAEDAVDWAQDHPKSSLHKALLWDDARAAREFRIDQVRSLIRLHVVSEDGSPQMVSLSFDRAQNGGYRAVSDVLKSRDLSAVMLQDALAELERVQVKYARVQELTNVWREVQEVKERRRRGRPHKQQAETHTAAQA